MRWALLLCMCTGCPLRDPVEIAKQKNEMQVRAAVHFVTKCAIHRPLKGCRADAKEIYRVELPK